MLTLNGVSAGYRDLVVLHDISLHVDEGEIVAIIGANGAGKTTTLRTISGFLRARTGAIEFAGRSLLNRLPHEIVKAGVVQVPEGRSLFGRLTVRENLLLGGYTLPAAERRARLESVYQLFPLLAERQQQVAATMSGGQQQMLAIGRALMARPRLLMLDEPSIGLDPKTTRAVFSAIGQIRSTGLAVLLVEQNALQTLHIADRAYVFESGQVALEGPASDVLKNPRIRSAYLGL
jgi:branched-chain amino acid transport system ATP-binding protein